MGERYPPTAADYASVAASRAQEENAKLSARVDRLERAFELLCEGMMDDAQRVLRKP